MNRSDINLLGNSTSGVNIGSGSCIFKCKDISGNTLQFKTISVAGSSLSIVTGDTMITICGAGGTTISGTTDYISKFNSTCNNIINSSILDSGTTNIRLLKNNVLIGNSTAPTTIKPSGNGCMSMQACGGLTLGNLTNCIFTNGSDLCSRTYSDLCINAGNTSTSGQNGKILYLRGGCTNNAIGGTVVICAGIATGAGTIGRVQTPNLPVKSSETCIVYIDASGNLSTGGGIGWSNLTNGSTVVGCGAKASGATVFQNTFYGVCAGANTTSGFNDIAVGYNALKNNTSGVGNVANGSQALQNNTSGCYNTANGTCALFCNTISNYNVAVGSFALGSNTNGSGNTANGTFALQNNTTGSNNIANGFYALFANTSGCFNIAVGFEALRNNIYGYANIANGYQALRNNTTGGLNIANGTCALYCNTSGGGNIAIGLLALKNNTSGGYNIAIGRETLGSNTSGGDNIANGFQALPSNTTGCNNIAVGDFTLYSNTCGNCNIAIGCFALGLNCTGCNNVAIGTCAGYNETGSNKLHIANSSYCTLIYGDFSTKCVKIDGKLEVGGSITPANSIDSGMPNNSIYFSTTSGKLVYKNASGVVNALY